MKLHKCQLNSTDLSTYAVNNHSIRNMKTSSHVKTMHPCVYVQLLTLADFILNLGEKTLLKSSLPGLIQWVRKNWLIFFLTVSNLATVSGSSVIGPKMSYRIFRSGYAIRVEQRIVIKIQTYLFYLGTIGTTLNRSAYGDNVFANIVSTKVGPSLLLRTLKFSVHNQSCICPVRNNLTGVSYLIFFFGEKQKEVYLEP